LGKLSIIPIPNGKQVKRILLAGIGKKEEITKDTIRTVSGKIAQKAKELKLEEFTIIVPPRSLGIQSSSVSEIVEGSKMALYIFNKFKSEKSENSPDLTLLVNKSEKTMSALRTSEIITNGAIYTKSISTTKRVYPNYISKFCKRDFQKENEMQNNFKNRIKKQRVWRNNGSGPR